MPRWDNDTISSVLMSGAICTVCMQVVNIGEPLPVPWTGRRRPISRELERENGRRLIRHEAIYRHTYWQVSGHKDYLHRLLPRAKFQRGWRGRKGGPAIGKRTSCCSTVAVASF